MDPLFVLPENLGELSAEELDNLLAEARQIADRVVAASKGEDDEMKSKLSELGLSPKDALVEIGNAVETITGEVEARESAATETEDEYRRIFGDGETGEEPAAGEGDGEDGDAAGEGDGEEPAAGDGEEPAAAETEPEPVAAASASRAVRRGARARVARDRTAREQTPGPVRITASAGSPEVAPGSDIAERQITDLLMARFAAVGGGGGPRVPGKHYVARAHARYDDERRLTSDNQENLRKIRDQTSPRALVAHGGLCAPVEPYYGLNVVGQAATPVIDSFATFNTPRGGIRFAPPMALSAIDTSGATGAAIKRIDAGATGDASATPADYTKPCQRIACPAFQEVDVAALAHCLEFGRLGTRAWPEQVEAATSLLDVAYARVRETAALDAVYAASKKVSDAQAVVDVSAGNNAGTAVQAAFRFGAYAELVAAMILAAESFRSTHRLDPEQRFRVLMPEWTLGLLLSDQERSQFYRQKQTEDELRAFLQAVAGVNITWTMDGRTGGGQVFPAQTDGTGQVIWPANVEWAIFPEGSFLHLDAGTLDLGLIVDSGLAATNDYRMFGEVFENYAFIGVESRWITSALVPSGATSGPGVRYAAGAAPAAGAA